jgi:hypothetical protein
MLVTLSDIEINVRDSHDLKADAPMLFNPFGNETDVRERHQLNASSPMLVTLPVL